MYYETQATGLGVRFILDVYELISTMLEFPRMGNVVDGTPPGLEIRRCIVQTFGVEIDYTLEPDELVIVAIFPHQPRTRILARPAQGTVGSAAAPGRPTQHS